jgi:hypothetical protein
MSSDMAIGIVSLPPCRTRLTGAIEDKAAAVAARAFGTVELLEAVLLNLPCAQLLSVRGVAKKWHQTIQGSIRLRRALFLKPAACSPIEAANTEVSGSLSSLNSPQTTDFVAAKGDGMWRFMVLDKDELTKVSAHDLEALRIKEAHRRHVIVAPLLYGLFARIDTFLGCLRFTCPLSKIQDLHQRSSASLRSMFATSPPVDMIHVKFSLEARDVPRDKYTAVIEKARASGWGFSIEMSACMVLRKAVVLSNSEGISLNDLVRCYELFAKLCSNVEEAKWMVHFDVRYGRRMADGTDSK